MKTHVHTNVRIYANATVVTYGAAQFCAHMHSHNISHGFTYVYIQGVTHVCAHVCVNIYAHQHLLDHAWETRHYRPPLFHDKNSEYL